MLLHTSIIASYYRIIVSIDTGQQLVAFARRMSDGTNESMDPAPLLRIFTILVKNNRKSYKVLWLIPAV